MTHGQLDASATLRLCNGNKEAMEWVQMGRLYCHEIDDLVDETIPAADTAVGVDRVCRIGMMALHLYTHPFFLKHSEALSAAMMVNTINYRDSVRCEKGNEWQRQFSDWARHGWIGVVQVVGLICSGYDVVAQESLGLWAVAHGLHHDDTGKAT